jgi:hypothetical protein
MSHQNPPEHHCWGDVETATKGGRQYPVPGRWEVEDHGKFHTIWKHQQGVKLVRSSIESPGPLDRFVFKLDGTEVHQVDTAPRREKLRKDTVWLLEFYENHQITSPEEFKQELRRERNQSLTDF